MMATKSWVLSIVSLAGVSATLLAMPALAQDSTWSEPFVALDDQIWETQIFSFPANGCNMTAGQVSVTDGTLRLGVMANPARTPASPKMCDGGEIGSRKFFTYGLFTVRMRPPDLPGGVSAFFLMNKWQPDNWEHREIDIEFPGGRPGAVQLTTHDFQNGGRDWKSAPATLDLGFAANQDFHDYAILWGPDAVTWYVDGHAVHKETRYVPHEPLQIRMNVYLGDPAEPGVVQWLGPIDPNHLAAAALYRDVRYYPLDALPSGYRPQ
jgi:beta-glucanase (GH16 family)